MFRNFRVVRSKTVTSPHERCNRQILGLLLAGRPATLLEDAALITGAVSAVDAQSLLREKSGLNAHAPSRCRGALPAAWKVSIEDGYAKLDTLVVERG